MLLLLGCVPLHYNLVSLCFLIVYNKSLQNEELDWKVQECTGGISRAATLMVSALLVENGNHGVGRQQMLPVVNTGAGVS